MTPFRRGLVTGLILGTLLMAVVVAVAAAATPPLTPAATMIGASPGAMRSAAAREENGSYPSNGRGSPRQRPALIGVSSRTNGAETAGGTPISSPSGTRSGIAAYAAPSFGNLYLAIPEGPGRRVKICVSGRCIERVSTDAGPALFRQREGRVADVSWSDFRYLCQCNPSVIGLLRVQVTAR